MITLPLLLPSDHGMAFANPRKMVALELGTSTQLIKAYSPMWHGTLLLTKIHFSPPFSRVLPELLLLDS
jgi:hypothetical protein